MATRAFWKRYPGAVVLLCLEFLAFIVVSYQVQVEPRLSLLEKMGLVIIGPLQEAGNSVTGFVQRRLEKRRELRALRLENAQLRRQLDRVNDLKTRLLERTKETERLSRLLQLPQDPAFDYQFCSVIGKSDRHGDFCFIIDKGSWDGLREDLGVVCQRGVVGIVWEVSPKYAKVMSLQNATCVVAAMLQDSRYRDAFVIGHDAVTGELENVPNFLDVQPTDTVLTSGMDGLFPKGLNIGTVISSERTSHMFRDIEIRFAASLASLEEVAVLVPRIEEGER